MKRLQVKKILKCRGMDESETDMVRRLNVFLATLDPSDVREVKETKFNYIVYYVKEVPNDE